MFLPDSTGVHGSMRWRYSIAIGAITIAFLLQFTFHSIFHHTNTLLFFSIAVLISAYYGGRATGLLATLLGALASFALRSWLGNDESFTPATLLIEIILFILFGVLVSVMTKPARVLDAPTDKTALWRDPKMFHLFVASVQNYAIFMLDANGFITSWNVGAEKIKGYRGDEIIGRHISHFYTAEDQANELPQRNLHEAIAHGSIEQEGWRVRKDGSTFYASESITAIRDRNGRLCGFAKIIRDSTAQKQMADVLTEEQARSELERIRLLTVLDILPVGVFIADAKGQILDVNQTAQAIWGTALPFSQVIEEYGEYKGWNPATREPITGEQWGLARAVTYGEPVLNETVNIEAFDGTHKTILNSAVPIRDADGAIINAVVVNVDITDRQRAENIHRFLADASTVLASSLDYELTLQQVARLAVPTLADWCTVDIITEDGKVQRIETAHVDPAQVQKARDIQQQYPFDPNARYGIAQVLRTGRPEFYPEIADELLAEAIQDHTYLNMLREAGITSYMAVPLIIRGRTMGVLSFIAAKSKRHYTTADLELVEELARRAAQAIDNAILYRLAQNEIAQRRHTEEALQQANVRLASVVSDLEQRAQHVNLLSELGNLLRLCCDAPEAYAVVAQYARRLFPTESGALCLIDSKQQRVTPVIIWGGAPPVTSDFTTDGCWGLRRVQMHLIEDQHPPLICPHFPTAPQHSSMCVPLQAQSVTWGVLLLQTDTSKEHGTDAETPRLEPRRWLGQSLAEHVALALSNIRLQESLREQAIRDPLTELLNRRAMEESFMREVSRAIRHEHSIAVVLLDIDYFKRINDTYGHAAGDLVLREVANLVQSNIRREDMGCRYGGEEFLIIMPGVTANAATQRAEEIRSAIQELSILHEGRILTGISASIGVALFPQNGDTPENVINCADAAMYKAKNTGRNRVILADLHSELCLSTLDQREA